MSHLSESQIQTIKKTVTLGAFKVSGSYAQEDLRMSIYTDDGKLAEELNAKTIVLLVNASAIIETLLRDIEQYQEEAKIVPDGNPELIEMQKRIDELTIMCKSNTQLIIKMQQQLRIAGFPD